MEWICQWIQCSGQHVCGNGVPFHKRSGPYGHSSRTVLFHVRGYQCTDQPTNCATWIPHIATDQSPGQGSHQATHKTTYDPKPQHHAHEAADQKAHGATTNAYQETVSAQPKIGQTVHQKVTAEMQLWVGVPWVAMFPRNRQKL